MNAKIKIIKKIALCLILVLLFSSVAVGSEINNPVNEYDSIYKYNALENKISFTDMMYGEKESAIENFTPDEKTVNDDLQKLEDTFKKQSDSIEKSEEAINAIENINGVKSFLIGKNLGALRFLMVQIKDQSYALRALVLNTENALAKDQINILIEISEQEEKKVESFILKQENKFSVFGWLVDLL